MPTLDLTALSFKNLSQRNLQKDANPKSGFLNVDFSVNASYDVDLTQIEMGSALSAILGFYIDNSANDSPFIITNSTTVQKITIPAGAQAYVPCLSVVPDKMTFASAGGVSVGVEFLNFRPDPIIWSTNATGGGAGSPLFVRDIFRSNLTLSSVTPGADAVVAATNASRSALILQAATTNAASAWINFGAVASPNNFIELPPGATFSMQEPGLVDTRDVHLFGTGGKVTVGVG